MSAGDEEVVLKITGRDVWEKLNSIEDTVKGIPARLDSLESRADSQDHRIRNLEHVLWGAVPVIAIATSVITRLIGG